MHTQLLIIGGGAAGISVAARLPREALYWRGCGAGRPDRYGRCAATPGAPTASAASYSRQLSAVGAPSNTAATNSSVSGRAAAMAPRWSAPG